MKRKDLPSDEASLCLNVPQRPRKRKSLSPLKLLICIGVFILFAFNASAQNTVTGVVTGDDGLTIPGVNVSVKGTNTTTVTNVDGKYSISASPSSTLVFSFVGFATQEILVNNRKVVSTKLSSSTVTLNELVVVGYGTQQKKDLTGAISVVRAKDVQERQATTLAEALQGQATGIKVRSSGAPGSEAQIQIRGIKNLANTNPLYVIDGMISTANRDFNVADIESIQILKDASSAAIYGSRAANGVIIITTKKGKEGAMRIEFSGKSSVQTAPRYKLAETEEFARLNFMAYDNAGVTRQQLNLGVNTNWQNEVMRTGNIKDYNLSFSGGSQNGTYLVSANYLGNKGTVISSGWDRFSLRVNTQAKKGIFTIGEHLAITRGKTDEVFGHNPWTDVYRMLPTIPVYDAANPGGYGYGNEQKARTFGTNPVAIADLNDRYVENTRIRGDFFSELQFTPFLKYRFNAGLDNSYGHVRTFRKPGNWTLNQPFDPAILTESRDEYVNYLVENTLSFNKSFGKHTVNAVAGQSYQRTTNADISGTKRNILYNPGANTYYDVLNGGNEPQTGGSRSRADLIRYFGRVEYNYDDRYLLNGVFSSDGSSLFGPSYKFGFFPSVSAAWRVSKEKFFNVSWINDLKVRASYGTVGSNPIEAYEYSTLINPNSTVVFGPAQTVQAGATNVQLANADLHWEKLTQQNYGFDATVLDNKLTLSAEYFIAKTEDVLLRYPLLLTTGNSGANPRVNGVSLNNSGFEFTATYREDSRPFKYGGSLNFTTVRNRVSDLGFTQSKTYSGNTVTEEGQPLGMWYVLQTNGLFQTQAEVDNYKNAAGKVIQPTSKPGDIRFKDNNGDGQITNDDKVVVGSPWPKYEFGLNVNAAYKGFEFSMDWFASVGYTVYNGYRSVVERFDDNSNYPAGIQPWTASNPNTTTPRAFYGSTLNSRGDTDRWLEDGGFARMKYIGLTYNVPTKLVKKIGFERMSLTISGQNLLTITKYKGLDPEFSNGSIFEKGADNSSFPNLKTYTLGLNFGF